MSNALAIAAVTAVLKDLLSSGLIDRDVSSHVGEVTVSASFPDRVLTNGAQEPTRLNLFMYQATPNTNWRNVGQPTFDARGARVSNPPLALDLHYLLTTYAAQDLHAEILLGHAMQLLHERPVLARKDIRRALESSSPDLVTLSASDLAEQVEQIKISPEVMGAEEMSRLWSALQTHYRPTAAYRASVVLIESHKPAKAPLPVLTRGRDDRGVRTQADPVPPLPTLVEVRPPDRQPSVRLEDTVSLKGHHLDGTDAMVRFTNTRSRKVLVAPALPESTAGEISVRLLDALDPDAPEDPPEKRWSAGIYSVAGLVQRPDEEQRRTTNELPLLLAPTITAPIECVKGADDEVTFTVKCEPEVRPEQQVALLVGQREIPAQPHTTHTNTLTFTTRLQPGEYVVRLRVDRVESVFVDRTGPRPVFDPSQEVTVP